MLAVVESYVAHTQNIPRTCALPVAQRVRAGLKSRRSSSPFNWLTAIIYGSGTFLGQLSLRKGLDDAFLVIIE